MKILKLLIGAALFTMTLCVNAADYTTLFDPATMQVGQSVGEYLTVKEYCPKTTTCTTTEKLKYVTALTGRTGRLEFPVSAGNDFEISFNIWAGGNCDSTDLTVTLYMSDSSSLPLDIGKCYTRVYYPDGKNEYLNWINGVNDFRLVVTQSILKISANDKFVNQTFSLSGTVNRIVISKINDGQEYLYEIRTRGVQYGGGSIQQGIAQCQANPASCGITAGAATKIDGIATNGFVSPANKMIAGVLISGGTKRTMVRASSVDGAVDPMVEIYTYPDRKLLGSNDSWATSTTAAELTQKKLAPARATDAATIISLPPGLFTMEVTSRNGGSGANVIEVYDMAVFP